MAKNQTNKLVFVHVGHLWGDPSRFIVSLLAGIYRNENRVHVFVVVSDPSSHSIA
jgi:hypothetical protein